MRIKISTFCVGVFFAFFFVFIATIFAQENITITTYYPSPNGVYQELRAAQMAIGDNYIDNSQFCWTGACTNQIGANADLVVEGNVGIGAFNPTAMLDVRGGVRIGDDTVCDVNKTGTLRFNSGKMQYCDGNTWVPLAVPQVSQEFTASIVNKWREEVLTDMGQQTVCFLTYQKIKIFDNEINNGSHENDNWYCSVEETPSGTGGMSTWKLHAYYDSKLNDGNNKGTNICKARCLKWE